jgi:hypothetical protein
MGLLLILFVFTFSAWLFIGLGALVCAKVFSYRPAQAAWAIWFWTGVLTLIAAALLLHFALPISGWLPLALTPAALLGWILEKPWQARPRFAGRSGTSLAIGISAAWVLLCALQAIKPATATDNGLYFIQTTLWFRSFRVVPGLAALHPCLGHNQTYFFWVSAFSLGPLFQRPWVVANGVLLVAAGLPGVLAVARLLTAPGRGLLPAEILQAILLAPLADALLSPAVSSPVADAAVLCAGAAGLGWLALVSTRGILLNEARWMLVMAATATTMKQPFLCITAPLCLACVARPLTELRRLSPALLGCVGLAALWMAHGIILSGYPLYPLPSFGVPVDWKLPEVVPRALSEYTFATHEWGAVRVKAGLLHSGWAWEWFEKRLTYNRLFIVPALALVTGWMAILFQRLRRRALRASLVYALLCALGLLIWWNMLPDERFAGALLWGAGFGIWALVFPARDLGGSWAWMLVVLLCLASADWGLYHPPSSLHLPPPPHGVERAYTLRSGDTVWNGADGLCFRLPCSLYRYSTLEFRHPGELASGFRRPIAGPLLP